MKSRQVLLLAVLSFSAAAPARAAVLVSENFESLTLQPFQSGTESGGDGTDWTPTLPAGWNMIFTGPVGDPIEWQGWRAVDVDSWIATEGDQGRSAWSRALIGQRDTALVADPDAYDDGTNIDTGLFNTSITTPVINLSTIVANSISIEFDSFWQNEETQMGLLDVSFDGGSNYTNLLTYDSAVLAPDQVIDERPLINVNNPGSGSLVFRFSMTNGSNDWWWAIDDVVINGTVVPEPGGPSLTAAAAILVCSVRRRKR